MGWDDLSGDRARFPGPVGHHVDHDATREAFLGSRKIQPNGSSTNTVLGSGFKYFLFSPLFGEMI